MQTKPNAANFPESTVTFEILQLGEACKLTLIHEGLAAGDRLTDGIFRGWSEILSGFKTLVETGEQLKIAAAN